MYVFSITIGAYLSLKLFRRPEFKSILVKLLLLSRKGGIKVVEFLKAHKSFVIFGLILVMAGIAQAASGIDLVAQIGTPPFPPDSLRVPIEAQPGTDIWTTVLHVVGYAIVLIGFYMMGKYGGGLVKKILCEKLKWIKNKKPDEGEVNIDGLRFEFRSLEFISKKAKDEWRVLMQEV